MPRDILKTLNHPNFIKNGILLSERAKNIKIENIKIYNINPKLCKQCNKPISYDKRMNNYCGHSCRAKYNNPKKPKHNNCCRNCNKRLKARARICCSRKCQTEYEQNDLERRWKIGELTGSTKALALCNFVRTYVFKKYNSKCHKCGWCEINQTSGRSPLQINHIDGNYINCKEDNLELLCPNCHSLTPNFGALNIGKGRKKRRDNYNRDKLKITPE